MMAAKAGLLPCDNFYHTIKRMDAACKKAEILSNKVEQRGLLIFPCHSKSKRTRADFFSSDDKWLILVSSASLYTDHGSVFLDCSIGHDLAQAAFMPRQHKDGSLSCEIAAQRFCKFTEFFR